MANNYKGFDWVPFTDEDIPPLCPNCRLFGQYPNFPCIINDDKDDPLACAALEEGRSRLYFQEAAHD